MTPPILPPAPRRGPSRRRTGRGWSRVRLGVGLALLLAGAGALPGGGADPLLSGPGATPLAAQESGGDEAAYRVLEEASRHFEGIGTLCARFHQRLDVPLLDQTKEGHGEICQRQPDLFSMRFEEPAGDLVVVDGTYAWIYQPSQDSMQVVRASTTELGPTLDFHRAFLAAPREKYVATDLDADTVDGRPTRHLELVPRTDPRFARAEVWIDRGPEPLLRKVRIRDENGSVRTVTLTDVRVEPGVSGGLFRFTPPPFARVVTR